MKVKYLAIIITALLLGVSAVFAGDSMPVRGKLVYRLHGQTRRFDAQFTPLDGGGLRLDWSIVRNLKLWKGSYTMSGKAVNEGSQLSFLMPEDGNHVMLPDNATFALMPEATFELLCSNGMADWNHTTYRLTGREEGRIHAVDVFEGAKIEVADNAACPLILSMKNNPLGIDWTFEYVKK